MGLEEEIQSSFLQYAMSTILVRADTSLPPCNSGGGVFADGEACSRTGRMQTIGTQRSARSYTFLTFRCCSITKSATDRTSFYTLSLYAEELTCTHTQCVCTSLVEIWTRRFAEGGVRETVVFFACAYFHILSIAVFYEPFGASHRPLALVARREERCPTYATD